MAQIEFTALLVAGPTGGQLPVPRDALGSRERVQVKGTANGKPFTAAAMPDGKGGHVIAFDSRLQEVVGARPGEKVRVVIPLPETEAPLEPPADFAKAIARNVQARPAWERLSVGQRRAYVELVLDSKKPELRARRIADSVQRIAMGKPRV